MHYPALHFRTMYRFADFSDDAAFRFAQDRLGGFRRAPPPKRKKLPGCGFFRKFEPDGAPGLSARRLVRCLIRILSVTAR
jgi:hypothetical protein